MSTADAELPVIPAIPGRPPRILVIRAPYYRKVIENLSEAACRLLSQAGVKIEVLDVAGAFELPQALRLAVRSRERFDAYVVLGCVIRGETDHYEYICTEAMHGLMEVALHFGLALGTGLLTVDTLEQAQARSQRDGPNKGAEAARAALMQLAAARRLGAV